ncbi:MAG: hypothetical protein ACF8XB_06710, partial [Planctomycetota bacterium JB042]
AGALLLGLASATSAGVVHDETTDGELSGDPNAPTPLAFELGSNTVSGTVVNASPRDYITFTLPPGTVLTAIQLPVYQFPNGNPGNTGYHSLAAGPTSFFPNLATGANFLGGDHIFGFQAGTDVLPGLASAAQNGTGFPSPLAAGTYTYQIQQTGPEVTDYQLDFMVECVGAATSVPYGAGKPGTNGVPVLSSNAPPVLGGASDLTISNGLAGAGPVLLFVGFSSTSLPFDGGALLVNPALTLTLPPLGPAGSLTLPAPLPPDPTLCGLSLFTQAMYADPAAGGFNQSAQTNGLQWTFGS